MPMLIFGARWLGVHVHDWAVEMNPGRIYLRCTTCLNESPGWDLSLSPPRKASSVLTFPNGGSRNADRHERRAAD
jgi:hypothetical protein